MHYGTKGSFKYFIGYIKESNAFSILLYIKRPQLKGYVKYFKDNKCMNFSVCDKILLKKQIEIWDKISRKRI